MTYLILLADGTWFEKTNRVGVPSWMQVFPPTHALFIDPVETAEALAAHLVHIPRVKLIGIDRRAGLAVYREEQT